MDGAKAVKTYKVALGGQPEGAKDRQGDHKTPEGMYSVDGKNPNSQFHKALHISYPSREDRDRAKKVGVSPGGDVEIHGLGAKWGWVGAEHRLTDSTDGCIAVTNEEIDEICPLIKLDAPIEITFLTPQANEILMPSWINDAGGLQRLLETHESDSNAKMRIVRNQSSECAATGVTTGRRNKWRKRVCSRSM